MSLAPPACFAKKHPLPDDSISIEVDDNSSEDGVAFLLNAERTIETTVTFNCADLKNLRPSMPLPYTFVISQPRKNQEFLHLQRTSPGSWRFGKWNFESKFGKASDLPTVDYAYALPYSPREHYRVIQSYFGSYSHYKGSQNEHAVDFDMPKGTVVTAARPGTVIAYREDSNVGGNSAEFKRSDNYVVIKHDDGTYASYAHFKQDSLFVKLGQKVEEGDKLGLSGATGWADRPHLHFAVYRVKDGTLVESIPFRMKVGNTVVRWLMEGQNY